MKLSAFLTWPAAPGGFFTSYFTHQQLNLVSRVLTIVFSLLGAAGLLFALDYLVDGYVTPDFFIISGLTAVLFLSLFAVRRKKIRLAVLLVWMALQACLLVEFIFLEPAAVGLYLVTAIIGFVICIMLSGFFFGASGVFVSLIFSVGTIVFPLCVHRLSGLYSSIGFISAGLFASSVLIVLIRNFLLFSLQELRSALSLKDEMARRAEQRLREKEVLIREIHHRVKNNLQIISSLIYLQGSDDPELLSRNTQSRIRAMGQVHNLLYRENVDEFINAASLLQRILDDSFTENRQVVIRLCSESDLLLSFDSAMMFGLVINEIITVLYSNKPLPLFDSGYPEGVVIYSIGVIRSDSRHLRLTVTSAEDHNHMVFPALSFKVIKALVSQMGGSFETGVVPGDIMIAVLPILEGTMNQE